MVKDYLLLQSTIQEMAIIEIKLSHDYNNNYSMNEASKMTKDKHLA